MFLTDVRKLSMPAARFRPGAFWNVRTAHNHKAHCFWLNWSRIPNH